MFAELPRENWWTIAGHAGVASPGGMRHSLSRALWDADGATAPRRRIRHPRTRDRGRAGARGVATFPVEVPPSQKGGRVWLFLRLDTNAGVRGNGEVRCSPARCRRARWPALVETQLLGHDPYEIELVWETLYARAGQAAGGGPYRVELAGALLHVRARHGP